MKPYKIDVAVLVIFFTRVEKTAQVFEEIKKARPRKLFLYQDGPRPNRKDDIENIKKCRTVVEDIDWDCEVHRLYQEKNFGCDPSEYIAQKWMFSHVDKGIILEDDDIPSQSFFPFCKELLDKYEHDTRINIICGMNNNDITDTDDSYIFSRYGSIWGWATWKRNVDLWDPTYAWLENTAIVESLKEAYPQDMPNIIKVCQRHKATGREHYESIMGANLYLQRQINIVPKYNMISNIGVGSESTHSVDSLSKLPKAVRKLLYKKRYEIEFPLRHPKYVIEDEKFNETFRQSKFTSFCRKVESRLYRYIPFLGRL